MTERYSGADIEKICRKVPNIPFKESIKTGIDRKITIDDIIKTIEDMSPSIIEKDLKKYQEFQWV